MIVCAYIPLQHHSHRPLRHHWEEHVRTEIQSHPHPRRQIDRVEVLRTGWSLLQMQNRNYVETRLSARSSLRKERKGRRGQRQVQKIMSSQIQSNLIQFLSVASSRTIFYSAFAFLLSLSLSLYSSFSLSLSLHHSFSLSLHLFFCLATSLSFSLFSSSLSSSLTFSSSFSSSISLSHLDGLCRQ